LDIALVTLDRNIGNRTGWMGIGYDGSSSYNLNTAGYPADAGYSGQTMYRDYAPGTVSGSHIYYGEPSIEGQSGSPLWSYYPSTGQRIIRGVLVGADGLSTRITPQVFNDFVNAMNSDARPAATSAKVTARAGSPLLGQAGASSPSLVADVAGRLLASLAVGGQGRDRLTTTDALFAAKPAAAAPASAAAQPAAAARPAADDRPASRVERRQTARAASLVLDALRSESLGPDLAGL
jgi:hypothetical protein